MEQKKEVKVTGLETIKKDITGMVLSKIDSFQKSGELRIPKDYSPENALKSAYIILTDPRNNLLEKCDKSSIANALLKMVVWGLSPLKKQCYFIPYKDQLECTPDYSGNIALAKRYGGLKSIKGNAIFEGDEFQFGINKEGKREVEKHVQSLQSLNTKVIGAYAVVTMEDGTIDTEIMSIEMIRKAWSQGGARGASPAHQNFTDQMAIKTVMNRACKLIIRSSSDAILYDEDEREALQQGEAEATVIENANMGDFVDFSDVEALQQGEAEAEETETEPDDGADHVAEPKPFDFDDEVPF